MNKKSTLKAICTVLICALLLSALTGCMTFAEESSEEINTEVVQTDNTQQTETDTPQSTEDESIEVDKGLFDVRITLPQSMFEDVDMDETIEEAKAKGVKEVKVNDDGSVTYTMSKKVHKAMADEVKVSLISIFEKAKGEDYKSILDIEYNDDFSKITLVVDKAKYQKSRDGFISFTIGSIATYYQRFLGMDKESIAIEIKDNATGEVFHTINYPKAVEDFKEKIKNITTDADE